MERKVPNTQEQVEGEVTALVYLPLLELCKATLLRATALTCF